jgi:xylulokinase
MPDKPYLLGIDIGGTGAKAGVFTMQGGAVGSGYTEYSMISHVPGQAEHDAENWWQCTISAIRQATRAIDTQDILAIGVGCTNGLIAIDRTGRPIRPAIMLWDQRALPEVERIRHALDSEEVFRITGNPVAPGAYSLPTILWLMHQEPETFRKVHKLMVPGGYIVGRLTGEYTIDHSRACTTLLFDIRRKEWHAPFLEALDIPAELLPRPLASQELAGSVTSVAAELTGLRPGTPVIAGCMDTIGASIGSGVVQAGGCFLIMGTATRLASPLDQPSFDPRFMNCTHVLPDSWLTLGAMNGVGSSLRWLRDNFGQMEQQIAHQTGQDVYDLLTAQAGSSPPGSKGLIYLPYISGERTPHWDPYARAVFFGITLGHNRSDFLRAALEGAAYAIRHVVEIMETERNIPVNALRIGGAAARSTIWNQIIADVLGKTVLSVESSHIEVHGAAILAGIGSGVYPNYPEGLEELIHISRTFTPDPATHAEYNQLFPIFKELYPSARPYFERLAKVDVSKVWVRKENDGRESHSG